MRKKTWRSKDGRDAWDAHVDETIRTLRDLVRKGREELETRRATA